MHSVYWSNTKFADWLRGTTKLKMGTSEEWESWYDSAKKAQPIRYWLAEEGLSMIQDFLTYPIRKAHDAKYYITNRWVNRTHSLTAHKRDVSPGSWCDVGNRFLPCLFNELVNFIEVEKAWSYIAWGGSEIREKYKTPFWASGWFRSGTWRCPAAGLDCLEWEMSLVYDGKPTTQALRATELKELYYWWTVTYRNRPDVYVASGWTEYCERIAELNESSFFDSKTTPELEKLSNRSHKLMRKIEAAYEKEDTEMMIRLIKIRDSLWT